MKLTAEATVLNDDKLTSSINNAQNTADSAKTIADNTNQYFWFTSSGSDTGAHISEKTQAEFIASPSGGNLLARSNGIAIREGTAELATMTAEGTDIKKGGVSVAFYGDTARVGKTSTRHVEVKDGGMQVYQDSSTVMAHIGYGSGNASSGTATAPYYTLGLRSGTAAADIGNYSVAEGYNTKASGYCSHAEGSMSLASGVDAHAEGYYTTASGEYSHTEGYSTTASKEYSHAEGYRTTASGMWSHAEGNFTTASGNCSHASGNYTIAAGVAQTAIGKYNVSDTSHLFIVGKGTSESARANAFHITSAGAVYVNGTSVHSSDRRLKEHISYVGDEAVDFINSLKPAHYIKDGEKHVGFYAQDVAEVDKWDCMIGEEMNGYMTLGYMELFAPIVAYVQRLEKRIEELERSK